MRASSGTRAPPLNSSKNLAATASTMTAAGRSAESLTGATAIGRPRDAAIVMFVTLALLVPFLGKPFHTDDPMYLWAAQQIRIAPLDFYGFIAYWEWTPLPMHLSMQNPPGASYFIALASMIAGWGEIGLHVAYLLPAIAWALGAYVLACRSCTRPLLAALLACTSPAFVVCATSTMSDVPMTCLWIWAVIAWDAGLRRGQARWLAIAAALIAIAALTKYFGAALVPLLMAYGIAFKRRLFLGLLWMAVPFASLIIYELWTAHLYGRGLLLGAIQYGAEVDLTAADLPVGLRAMTLLCFVGGSMIGVAFLSLRAWSMRACGMVVIASVLATVTLVDLRHWEELQPFASTDAAWLLIAQMCVMVMCGISVIAAAIMDAVRRREAASALLGFWIVGTAFFSGFLNWAITARTILPLAPAAAILIVRRMEDREGARADTILHEASGSSWKASWPLVPSAVISLAAAWGDASFAVQARDAARSLIADAPPGARMWYLGHWGFQHYAQQAGATALNLDEIDLHVGDRIIVPWTNSGVIRLPPEGVVLERRIESQASRWVSTLSPKRGAAFHSSVHGPMPYVFGRMPPDLHDQYVTVIAIETVSDEHEH